MQRSICLRWGEGAPSCQPPLRLPRGLSEPASPQTRFMASSGVVPPRKRTAWRARAHRGRRATPHENGQTQNFSRRLSVRWRRHACVSGRFFARCPATPAVPATPGAPGTPAALGLLPGRSGMRGLFWPPCQSLRHHLHTAKNCARFVSMEDSRGLYYLPRPGIPQVRMYVRRGEGGAVEFRMWDSGHPEVWDKHEWLPLSVVEKAAGMYVMARAMRGGEEAANLLSDEQLRIICAGYDLEPNEDFLS